MTPRLLALAIPASLILLVLFFISVRQMSFRQHTEFEIYQSGLPFEGGFAVCNSCNAIYFSSPTTGKGDIYTFDRETHSLERACGTDECDVTPVVSSDGAQIAYCRQYLNRSEVILVDISSGESRSLHSDFPFNFPIAFSQDNRHLLIAQYVPTGRNGHSIVDLESNEEVSLPGVFFINFSSSDPETIVGVTKHADGVSWVGEWNLEGNLVRWVTRGVRVEPVANSSELLVSRDSQWFLVTDVGEHQLPIAGDRVHITKVDNIVTFWNDSTRQLGTFNVGTDQLIVKEVPQVRVCGMSSTDGIILFHLYFWDRHEDILHEFNIETCELIPLLSVDDARVILDD